MAARQSATVVLAGGHESDGGRDLAALVGRVPAAPEYVVHAAAAAGRPLAEAVRSALGAGDAPVCVVPMTLGRDPGLIADTARALRWLAAGEGRGRLALTAPFGATEHLIGWLRAAAATAGSADALLVTAPAAGPFEDAELFRIARLVRQYGRHQRVEVAFIGGDPDPAEGVRRCRLLGADRVTAVPASFGPALPGGPAAGPSVGPSVGPTTGGEDVRDGGPLLRPSAIAGVVAARTAAALHLLGHGEDGILAGLDAEHGHGYAHSHGPGEQQHSHGPGGTPPSDPRTPTDQQQHQHRHQHTPTNPHPHAHTPTEPAEREASHVR
ncbi:cobalamin biosynthesis protein CbiX [Kitasatospora sp. NPDC096128]|uniref:sirohydrochlorin chelatase n=1 Tax=Kitasatospora sp. NPDC096128 TaxID=3155547 RepID=UPI0033233C60